jgi:Protein of unknown function (DUF664)
MIVALRRSARSPSDRSGDRQLVRKANTDPTSTEGRRVLLSESLVAARLTAMIDEFAKAYLHDDLQWARTSLVGKLDGLSEYDIRRPLTLTGTNLLGLVKH